MEFLNDFICTLLIIISIFATMVGMLCAFEHADLLAISEKPLGYFDKKTLSRLLWIGTIAGLVVLFCLVIRSILRDQNIWTFILSVGIYKALIIPGCWAISYLLPSKRKRVVKKRLKTKKAST